MRSEGDENLLDLIQPGRLRWPSEVRRWIFYKTHELFKDDRTSRHLPEYNGEVALKAQYFCDSRGRKREKTERREKGT